jgi:hypothetical protein
LAYALPRFPSNRLPPTLHYSKSANSLTFPTIKARVVVRKKPEDLISGQHRGIVFDDDVPRLASPAQHASLVCDTMAVFH